MKVRIIVDSAADLTAEVKSQVTMIPLTVSFDDEEFADGIALSREEFYQRLESSDVLPKTSQASPAVYAEYYQVVADAGESAVVITLASALSGTYQSAMIASEEYPHIYVVDSKTATVGIGILTMRALELVAEGKDAKTVAEVLEQEKQDIRLVAVLDTLEYMKRGGRISKATAFAGNLLNIKPVISVQDGRIQVIGKARGSKQGNSMMLQQIAQGGGVDMARPYMLGYTGLSDEMLQRLMEDSDALWPEAPATAGIGSVIGVHAGPGAVAIAYFKKLSNTEE